MKLYVVHGLPATGKTTIAAKLHQMHEGSVLIAKDDIKEKLLLESPNLTVEENRNLSNTTREMQMQLIEESMDQNQPVIIAEGNFVPELHSPQLRELAEKYGYQVQQIFCDAPREVVEARYLERASSSDRAEGHEKTLDWDYAKRYALPLDIGGDLVTIDESVDITDEAVLEKVLAV